MHACPQPAPSALDLLPTPHTGRGSTGQLGTGGFVDSAVPVPGGGGLNFASISGGGDFTCARTSAGAAYCWGAPAAQLRA